MAFSEICRICLSVNVRMFVLKKTGLQNLYQTLTNRFMDENEGPIIVCFTCHARLIRCRRLQQQALESNAVLEQLLAGGSMSIPNPHVARDEIQFTQICHIDIRPVECDITNDCKDEIFSLESVKVEEENFDNEYTKFEENGNHEIDTAENTEGLEINAEDLEIDAFGDFIEVGSKSEEKYKTVELKKEHKINKKIDDDIEQHIPTNNFSKLSERKIKTNSTDSNILKDMRKGNIDLENPTIKSKPKVQKDNQPINKKGKHPAKIMKKKILNQKSVNILTKKTSGSPTKFIFECDCCSKKFSTKDILAKHISYTHKMQKNSDTPAVRTQVEQIPVPQLTEIFNCDICEFKTSRKRYILAHLKAHVAKQVYCCNYCDYKCIRKNSWQRHMKMHTGKKPFSCHICEFKCKNKYNLKDHIKTHTGAKPFSCNICEFRCNTKRSLQKHMKIHIEEKPFSCNICEYKCIKKSNLQTHIKKHTGEKPFSCNICEFKCITKGNLQYHFIKKHPLEKPSSCHICEYKCFTASSLLTHMKIHTGEKPFSCNNCGYKCIRKDKLQSHMEIHTVGKPFSCNICEYTCTIKGSLLKHMKIHTGEKLFSCNICDYISIRKSTLQRHMKIHTAVKLFS